VAEAQVFSLNLSIYLAFNRTLFALVMTRYIPNIDISHLTW